MSNINTPQFDAFVNHFTSCAFCRPRHNIYCGWGRKLWIDDKAAFVARLETKKKRQYWLNEMKKQEPKYIDAIKQKVLEFFKNGNT